ncbi:calcium-translocating P-type ATPase [Basidiobolus meristosporus CBS 931.73]|uniref:Calcium-transporting ATPase n=1 Tax=Basidiobolus meristosporus CBS 931.73 TaxID=1314790 RepID=A0A1Y1Z6L3_9FUNG|nr:calcium-translocating P-type ATPase [Basidiobolus meristosporus CBS 931.73]|eukprot:ORY05891.1 calcium-translocating P-type ATPase [Basidiobolus meristosporus CBS 931.73]
MVESSGKEGVEIEVSQLQGPEFSFTPAQIMEWIDNKDLQALLHIGGIDGIIHGLHTDAELGLQTEEAIDENTSSHVPPDKPIVDTLITSLNERRQVFGTNTLPEAKAKSIFQLIWMAYQDKMLILLTIAALVSLALGIYEDVTRTDEAEIHWVEGFAIIVAILIVILVGSINDFQKEKQFRNLNRKKEDREIKVARNGSTCLISIHDLLVGDILHLEPGDVIAGDGVFISGYNIKCDESAVTGESDALSKLSIADCVKELEASSSRHLPDPFLISGSKVLEGVGTCVVVAVGVNSFNGRTMMSLRSESTETPLQLKLNNLAETIAKLGGAAAVVMLIVLLLQYLIPFKDGIPPATVIIDRIVDIFITTITIVVVAVPEGLPLAVTLALAFATTKMLKDNNLVRVLSACETMGSATAICSDKTGTLTQNKMSIVAGFIGSTLSFMQEGSITTEPQLPPSNLQQIEFSKIASQLSSPTTDLLHESIAINSSAFEGVNSQGVKTFVGSKTETAMLDWMRDMANVDYQQVRNRYSLAQQWPFSSAKKSMSSLVRISKEGREFHRLYVKGASEIILGRCKYILDVGESQEVLSSKELTKDLNATIEKIITLYASNSLRTIGFAYKDFDDLDNVEDEVALEQDMTWIGVVGIEDPLRPGVPEAVKACQKAGITVRMVTGDNILTAKSIASKCGIYDQNGIVMEGPRFRKLTHYQMMAILPRLQVLARSSPEDKKILVGKLRELGNVVAVTGDGTNDGPALKLADIGFSMGIAGTEVAKEASSIILMDDNFSSIVKAVSWGRSVNDAVKKFLQFQLTVNVTAVVLAFVSAVSDNEQSSVLTAVQLLWVNLIMDTLAALALATDPPTPELLNRPPTPRTASLITFTMWKMILGQAIFQITVSLVLLYTGPTLLRIDTNIDSQKQGLNTLIFNTFVFMQIFNEINCRRLDNKLNIFYNIHKNNFFIVIFFLMVIGQVLIVNFGGAAFSTVRIGWLYWVISLVIGMLSIPIGAFIRLIPNSFFGVTSDEADMENPALREWNSPSKHVRDELSLVKSLRGGRLRTTTRTHKNQVYAAAVFPSLVATIVGGGNAADNALPSEMDESTFFRFLDEHSVQTDQPPTS